MLRVLRTLNAGEDQNQYYQHCSKMSTSEWNKRSPRSSQAAEPGLPLSGRHPAASGKIPNPDAVSNVSVERVLYDATHIEAPVRAESHSASCGGLL
jgi:hypothetical protein